MATQPTHAGAAREPAKGNRHGADSAQHQAAHTGHHHKGHGGGHGDGHGGHEGGSWIITYCDMVTLLIACFICIITFASSEKEKYGRKRDSLLFGTGGIGIAGPPADGQDLDSVVHRERPLSARLGQNGSEVLPLHSSPGLEAAAEAIRQLEGPVLGTLQDSYSLQLSLKLLLGPDNKLTDVGRGILQAIAANVRNLPYDIYFQVADSEALPKAVLFTTFLGTQQGIPPGRMGIGVRPGGSSSPDSVWLFFSRQQ